MHFSMKFDNVKLIKNSAVTSLLLLLVVVATSNANPLRRCGENRFFDRVAQICTNCDDICDPRRGTSYMCDRYADECLRTREYNNVVALSVCSLYMFVV